MRAVFALFVILCLLRGGAAAMAGESASVLYVSNERDDTVSVIDAATRQVRATWPVGKRPRGIHVSADGSRLYVALSGSPRLGPGADPERVKSAQADKAADGIGIVDTATGRLLRKVSVGSDPEQFVVMPDGRRVIVANEDEATASCWDLETGRRVFVTPVSEEPEGVALRPGTADVYITCEQRGDVFVINGDTGAPLARFHVRGRPRSVAFAPDGRAFVPAEGEAEVSVVNTATHDVERVIKIAGPDVLPMCAVAGKSGREIYVSTGRGNTVAVIDAEHATVSATIPVRRRPWGMALSADGRSLYAANGLSDDISVIDVEARREIARIKVGAGPWGIAVGLVPEKSAP